MAEDIGIMKGNCEKVWKEINGFNKGQDL